MNTVYFRILAWPCCVLGLVCWVLGLGLATFFFRGLGLGLGLACCVLGLGLGLVPRVLVNITVSLFGKVVLGAEASRTIFVVQWEKTG